MRAFIAIPIPEASKEILNQIQQHLRDFKADVRWASIPSVHLTLKFLGEVDPVIIPDLAASLQIEARAFPRISLRLSGIGCFPNSKNPRVIWCGIDGDTEVLSGLQQKVETECLKYGLLQEDRKFHPHLTLGRVISNRNLKPLLDSIKIGSDLESSFRADHFNIYRSELKPKGAVYTVLSTITHNSPIMGVPKKE